MLTNATTVVPVAASLTYRIVANSAEYDDWERIHEDLPTVPSLKMKVLDVESNTPLVPVMPPDTGR